jgi:uncharacterized membrane protein
LIFFDAGFHTLLFEVIAAIGFGFVVLSFLLRVSVKSIGILGLSILFCHNILPIIPFEQDSIVKAVLSPFFNPNAFPFLTNRVFIMAYPPIPWLGIMLVGFASGKFFELPALQKKQLFFKIGCAALLLFMILRFINVYGDPAPWSPQKKTLYTFLSFLNVTKYPPSLMFCLGTLGIMFLILAAAEQHAKGWFSKVAFAYGKVPLFYFLAHFFIVHATLIVILFIQGFHWSQLDFASGTFGRPKGVESGVSLLIVYFIWVIVVWLLYKPCLWFGQYKREHKYWWLKYI